MPSMSPRMPEVRTRKDPDSGFEVNVHDGEYMIRVRPHVNGYQVGLASKSDVADQTFLRTYERNEHYRDYLKQSYPAIDVDEIFEMFDEHFDDEEYRIVDVRSGIRGVGGTGAHIDVETGRTVPALIGERDYRDDVWESSGKVCFTIWPNENYVEVNDTESGKKIATYWPTCDLDEIRNEEKDDHERERGPTCVPGVHRPIKPGDTVDDGPVVHTRYDCPHLKKLKHAEFIPPGEDPPLLHARGLCELPLRWCHWCSFCYPTPEELSDRYAPG